MVNSQDREDALRQHFGFAQRLARSLVQDASAADDLVQDAWVAVMQRPPRVAERFRAYLATILRRGAARRLRGEARRDDREAFAAREEAQPSALDLNEAMEAHGLVMDALRELDERSREVLLLKHFEDLPPRAIAARLGIPVETVRTRHRRAIDKVRARLEERDRSAFSALALLAAPSKSASEMPLRPWLASIFTVSGVSKLVGAIVLVALVGALAVDRWPTPLEPDSVNEPVVPLSRELVERTEEVPAEELTEIDQSSPVESRALVASPPESMPEKAQGRVIVVREDGSELHKEDGVVRAVFDQNPPEEMVVQAGQFELPAQFKSLRIESVITLGGPMRLVAAPTHEDGFWTLRVSPHPIFTLHVVDVETGKPLKDLTLLENVLNVGAKTFPSNWTERHVHARGLSSPLSLSSGSSTVRYWIHAPGYIWKDVRLDHRSSGERTIALRPEGGALRVHVVGGMEAMESEVIDSDQLFVRAYGESAWPVAERRVDGEEVLLQGLAVGSYEVRLELGTGAKALVIDRLEITVVRGVESTMTLNYMNPVGELPEANLSGIIHGDAQDLDWELSIQRRGARLRSNDQARFKVSELEAVPGSPGSYRLSSLRVTRGTYLVSVPGRWARHDVDVSGESAEFELTLPKLAKVTVVSIDGATGDPLPLRRLGYRTDLSTSKSWRFSPTAATEFELRLPYGQVVLMTPSEGVNWAEDRFEIREAEQRIELRSRRRTGFRLKLLDGDTPVPPGTSTAVRVTTSRGVQEFHGYHTGDAWYVLDEAELIRVEIDQVSGYEPIPPQELLLRWDEPNELTIPLVPMSDGR